MTPNLPRIIALAPGGAEGVAATVAAARAGALGMLDLEGVEPGSAREAAVRAARFANALGVRVTAGLVADDWLDSLPQGVRVVCCISDGGADWLGVLGRIGRSGRIAMAEVTARADVARAAGAGASGVILAGHEAGGNGSDESSFILLQAVAAEGKLPAGVRGGVGRLSAAGCIAAGAAGVVLDGALLLAKESPLDEAARAMIARFDGAESVVIRRATGQAVRVFAPPGSRAIAGLRSETEPSDPRRKK